VEVLSMGRQDLSTKRLMENFLKAGQG